MPHVRRDLCVTEFALAEGLLEQQAETLRKLRSAPATTHAIQIYGANAQHLALRSRLAERG